MDTIPVVCGCMCVCKELYSNKPWSNVFQHGDKAHFDPACFGVVDFFCSMAFLLNFLYLTTMHLKAKRKGW